MHTINIAKQFTETPGARYKTDGPFSGQLFREQFLEPLFRDAEDQSPITIVLDGTAGYGTSFLEEAFGGLARDYGKERCLRRLQFVSSDEPLLIDEIKGYINESEG
jgi:hypothetical protein